MSGTVCSLHGVHWNNFTVKLHTKESVYIIFLPSVSFTLFIHFLFSLSTYSALVLVYLYDDSFNS